MDSAVGYILCLGVTVAAIAGLRPLALRWGLLDRPGGHKRHEYPVPLTGGLGLFAGVLAGMVALGTRGEVFWPLLAGGAMLVIVGLLDDLRHWPAWSRFAMQGLAALVMALWGGVILEDFGRLFPWLDTLALGWLSIPVTVFATVGVINALNMSDGMDGLAGGLSLVAILPALGVAAVAGQGSYVELLLLLALGAAGFLAFNWPVPGRGRALAFLGDAGSTFLGFGIAWGLIGLSQGEDAAMTPVTALWLFALPLMDTVSLMIRRGLRGCSPFTADCEHLHHLLVQAGYSRREAVLLMVGIGTALALVGLVGLAYAVPQWLMFAGFLALYAAYHWAMLHAWGLVRALHWDVEHHGGLLPGRGASAQPREEST